MDSKLLRYLHQKGTALRIPVGGTFELTPRCNFNCKMCYVHLTEAEQRQKGKELTAEQWIEIGEEAKQAGTVALLLTGGEPTLRPDFPEIFERLKAMGFIMSVNTNGLLVQNDILRLFQKNPPARINLSLYGMSNETYERQCGLPVFDTIMNNIRTLRESGIDVKVSMSVTPDNCTDVQAVHDQAKALGVFMRSTPYMFPPVRLHPEMCGTNFRLEAEEAGVLMAEYEAANCTEEQLRRRYDDLKNGVLPPTENDDDCDIEGEGIHCRGGLTTFWIDWDGKMLPCGQMAEPAVDVLSVGFSEAWRRTRQAAEEIRLPAECTACEIKNICHPCASMCYCETGRFDGKPEYVCRMRHRYVERLTELCKERFGG